MAKNHKFEGSFDADDPDYEKSARIIADKDYPDAVWLYMDEQFRLIKAVLKGDNDQGTKAYAEGHWSPPDLRANFQAQQMGMKPDDGGWTIGGTAKLRHVLYNLNPLLNSAARITVYICEGEKDADALTAIGLLAVCVAGATRQMQQEWNSWLAGCNVVLVPDNDGRGRSRALKIIDSLDALPEKLRPATISVLDLGVQWFQCPDRGDAYDFLHHQARREGFGEVWAEATKYHVEDDWKEQLSEWAQRTDELSEDDVPAVMIQHLELLSREQISKLREAFEELAALAIEAHEWVPMVHNEVLNERAYGAGGWAADLVRVDHAAKGKPLMLYAHGGSHDKKSFLEANSGTRGKLIIGRTQAGDLKMQPLALSVWDRPGQGICDVIMPHPKKEKVYTIKQGHGVELNAYNSYKFPDLPPLAKPRPGMVEFWHHFWETAYGEGDAKLLLGNFRHTVQSPHERSGRQSQLQSPKGFAKTVSTTEVFGHCLGWPNVGVVDLSNLNSDFNSFAAGKPVLVFDEIDIDNVHKRGLTEKKMRPHVSNKIVQYVGKGQNAFEAENIADTYGLLNNVENFFVMDEEENRYEPYICRYQTQADIHDAFNLDMFRFFELEHLVEKSGAEDAPYEYQFTTALNYYLREAGGFEAIRYDYTNGEARPSFLRGTKTSGFKEAVSSSKGERAKLIERSMEEKKPGFTGGIISANAVRFEMKQENMRVNDLENHWLSGDMKSLGYVHSSSVKVSRKIPDPRLFALPGQEVQNYVRLYFTEEVRRKCLKDGKVKTGLLATEYLKSYELVEIEDDNESEEDRKVVALGTKLAKLEAMRNM